MTDWPQSTPRRELAVGAPPLRTRRRAGCRGLLAALVALLTMLAAAGCDDDATIAVPLSQPAYLYVAIRTPGAVQPYTIDPDTGLVSQNGPAAAAGGNTTSLALTPDNRFLYAANFGSNDVHGYEVDLGTGRLSAVPGVSFAAGTVPTGVAVDPSGQFAYVINQSSTDVWRYSINQNTGRLTFLGITPAIAGAPQVVVVAPGGYLYFGTGSGEVEGYAINPANGNLSGVPGNPLVIGGADIFALTVNAAGTRLYVGDDAATSLWVVDVDTGNGSMSAAPSSPYFPGGNPRGVAVDRTDSYVLTANFGTSDVSRFAVNANSSLNPLGDVPVGTNPQSVHIEPTGQYVYVSNQGDNTVRAYVLEANGGLTEISGSPVATPATQPQEVIAIALP